MPEALVHAVVEHFTSWYCDSLANASLNVLDALVTVCNW